MDHPSVALPSYVDSGPSIETRNLRAAKALAYILNGKMFGKRQRNEFTVVLPDGIRVGWLTRLRMLRQFWRISRGVL